ncbi:unnamed protein product [Staurois parvus]|uniref:Uncharacterized protein n=1 Tax=Staurois parvus TaxID=386267 RepID=A0ABN9GLG3_9NEOB|nr:unnamed protein product [Staurois parvus]
MYIHTHTETCTHIYRYMYTHRHVQTRIHMHAQKYKRTNPCIYTCTHRHMYVHTHTYMHTYTHVDTHTPYKKLQYFVVHSQSRVLHSRWRQRAQHTLLPLLSLRSAIEQSDSSQCQ